jgi:hypothetical protein
MHDGRHTRKGAHIDIPAFEAEVRGAALAAIGLVDGDLAWVDPQVTARVGDAVLARVRRGRRWHLQFGRLIRPHGRRVYLSLSEPTHPSAPLHAARFEVVGAVISAVVQLRRPMVDVDFRYENSAGGLPQPTARLDLPRPARRATGAVVVGSAGKT